jgi:hypothetical protein
MKLFLSIVIFISFWIIRGLFYWNKAYQLKKIRKHYHSYLAKKDEVFLQKKQAVISLFKEAGVKDFSVPHYEHLSHNQAYRHSLSGFDNLNVGREDVVGIVKLKFDEAIGAFNTKMHQSYNPFFWLEFIIKLPNKILQFIRKHSLKTVL